MRIEIISGSPRTNSITHRVALHLEQAIRERGHSEVGIIDMRETQFPEIESVFISPDKAPAALQPVVKRVFDADAFILLTPEYNGTYSATLKNFIDHFPKQHRKVFGIATASTGAMGGIRSALQLQELTYALLGIGSPYMLVTPFVDKKFDAQGNLLDENFQKAIDLFLNEFLWLTATVVEQKVITE